MTGSADSDAEPRRPGRLERRKARTRAAIIEAASTLFREHGYDYTAIQQIADAADTGVGTLYGYFRSKEDVLRAVIETQAAEVIERSHGTIEATATHIDRLLAAIDLHARFARANQGILRAAFELAARDGTVGEQPTKGVFEAYLALIQAGIDAGEFQRVPVETTARTILGTYTLAMLGIGVFQGQHDNPRTRQDLDTMTRMFLTGR